MFAGPEVHIFIYPGILKSTLSAFKTVNMTFCVDEVLISKIQDAVKEIGAEIRVANNFTCGTSSSTNDNNDKRLECRFILLKNLL
jgi:signal recognition particle subunit SEC65